MAQPNAFAALFAQLKPLLAAYAGRLDVTTDAPSAYELYSRHRLKNKQPLFFGSVAIKQRYVSYHLMPVYLFPDLLDGCPDPLRRRMQGKSCFNFTTMDEQMRTDLEALTRKCFARYDVEGLL